MCAAKRFLFAHKSGSPSDSPPPAQPIDGDGDAPLSPEEARAICYQALTVEQRAQFEQTLEINASYEVAGLGVFEVNLFKARGHVCGVFHFTRG